MNTSGFMKRISYHLSARGVDIKRQDGRLNETANKRCGVFSVARGVGRVVFVYGVVYHGCH